MPTRGMSLGNRRPSFYNAKMRWPFSWAGITSLLLVLLLGRLCGQTSVQPFSERKDDAGITLSPDLALEIPPPAAPAHTFWDHENVLLFSGIALTRGLDYVSTRNMQARGRKEILLAPEVVNNSAAFASLEAAGTMSSVGISYIFHRTGHHKLERWMSIGHISVTGFGDIPNYCLQSKRPR